MSLTLLIEWKHLVTNNQARAIAEAQVERIVRRTRSGLDSGGFPFAPYALHGPRSGAVDLTETGAMLNSLRVMEWTPAGALLVCADEKAEFHQYGEGHNPERHWLGTTEEEQQQMDADALRFAALNFQRKDTPP